MPSRRPPKIRIWRILNGLTQTEAAGVYGYSLRHYQRMEYRQARTPKRLHALMLRKRKPAR